MARVLGLNSLSGLLYWILGLCPSNYHYVANKCFQLFLGTISRDSLDCKDGKVKYDLDDIDGFFLRTMGKYASNILVLSSYFQDLWVGRLFIYLQLSQCKNREPETLQNTRHFGSFMAERQHSCCLGTLPCNCKQIPSLLTPTKEPTLVCLINVMHALLNFGPTSTLHDLIWPCTFIDFWTFFQSVWNEILNFFSRLQPFWKMQFSEI